MCWRLGMVHILLTVLSDRSGWRPAVCPHFGGDVLEHMIGHITYQQSFQAGLGGIPLFVHILQGSIESGGCSGGVRGVVLPTWGPFRQGWVASRCLLTKPQPSCI